jgi:hypothetical protein
MPKQDRNRKRTVVREPIQVYLTGDERGVLDRLAEELGVSRAEILRRGLQSYAVEQAQGRSPVLDLVREMHGTDWPIGGHDELLADAYREEIE